MIALRTSSWLQSPVPAERPIVAVGDVHGRDDLFAVLLGYLAEFVLPRLRDPLIVFLGDLIGKGPAGIAALARAYAFRPPHAEVLTLPGNHEQTALATFAHDDPVARATAWHLWARGAGRPVLREIGVAEDVRADLGAVALARALNPLLVGMIGRPVARRAGAWILVHGAATPGCLHLLFEPALPPPNPEAHPLWAKNWHAALTPPLPPGIAALHGHVPCEKTEILPWRVNLDTKAWRSGILTAAEIDGSRLRLHQAIGPAISSKRLEIPSKAAKNND